jgi:hypothetical protein
VTDYFVSSSTGSNANNGTSSGTPWLDTTNVNTTVYAGGDTVSFKGGETITGAVAITQDNWGGAQTYSPVRNSGNFTLSGGSLVATQNAGGSNDQPIFGTLVRSTGKFVFSVVLTTLGAHGGVIGIGNALAFRDPGYFIGKDLNSVGIITTSGHVEFNNLSPLATGFIFAQGDRVWVAVDLGAKTVQFNKNSGTWSATADISTMTNFAMTVAVSTWTLNDAFTLDVTTAAPAGISGFSLFTATGTTPSAISPVTFGSYGGGQSTISSASLAAMTARNTPAIVVQNLICTAGAGNPAVDGIQIGTDFKATFFQVLNCTVSGYGVNGIRLFSNGTGTGGGIDSVLVSGCTTHDCTGASQSSTAGIRIHGVYPTYNNTNVHITGCLSYNNTGATGQSNWAGTGIIIQECGGTGLTDVNGNACGALIDNCVAHDNGANSNFASGGNFGIWFGVVTNGITQFCESYLNKTLTGDGGGFDLDGGCINCTIQYCYSHDNDGQGYMIYQYTDTGLANSSGNTVRYCISQNDGANASATFPCGIMIGSDGGASSQTGASVYNNTIYTSHSSACAVRLQGANLATVTGHVTNNILYTTAGLQFIKTDAFNPSGLLFNKNDYFMVSGALSILWNGTTYTTIAAWRAATSQETLVAADTSLASDPTLVNPGGGGTLGGYIPSSLGAYKLQAGSPMRGVGLNMSSNFSISAGSNDFFASTIPNPFGTGFNVGADGTGGTPGMGSRNLSMMP